MAATTSTPPTTAPITGEQTLNEIVAQHPAALAVFDRYGLDSCCGGAKALATVCSSHHLVLDDVLRDLRAVA